MKFEKVNGMDFSRYIASMLLTDSSYRGDKYYKKEDELTSKIEKCLEQAQPDDLSRYAIAQQEQKSNHMNDINDYLDTNNRQATDDDKEMILEFYEDFLEESSNWNYNLREAVNKVLGLEEDV